MILVGINQQGTMMIAVRLTQFCGCSRNLNRDEENQDKLMLSVVPKRKLFLSRSKCSSLVSCMNQSTTLVWVCFAVVRVSRVHKAFLLCKRLFFNIVPGSFVERVCVCACFLSIRVGNFHCRTNLSRTCSLPSQSQTNKLSQVNVLCC